MPCEGEKVETIRGTARLIGLHVLFASTVFASFIVHYGLLTFADFISMILSIKV